MNLASGDVLPQIPGPPPHQSENPAHTPPESKTSLTTPALLALTCFIFLRSTFHHLANYILRFPQSSQVECKLCELQAMVSFAQGYIPSMYTQRSPYLLCPLNK